MLVHADARQRSNRNACTHDHFGNLSCMLLQDYQLRFGESRTAAIVTYAGASGIVGRRPMKKWSHAALSGVGSGRTWHAAMGHSPKDLAPVV
jgi:hypothetical protein